MFLVRLVFAYNINQWFKNLYISYEFVYAGDFVFVCHEIAMSS